ncbi:MAG: M23 family metallopeptidase [Fibrobacter sp.]|nr:M23 family metallopeptidase [Fibrobacter sp.]
MNKSKHYTLMFIPDDNGKTFTLKIKRYVLHSIIIFTIFFIIGLIMLLYKSGEIAAKLQLMHLMKIENEQLSRENQNFKRLYRKLEDVERLSAYIHKLAVPAVKTSSEIKNKKPEIEKGELAGEAVNNLGITRSQTIFSSDESVDMVSSIPNIPPVEGWITRQFSEDSLGLQAGHLGLDFAAAHGTPIRATAYGTVESIQNDKFYGLSVTIRHDHGFVTKYSHCSQILIKDQDNVKRGQAIALVGSTGRSTAPHLHYEILKDGKNVDPANYLLVHQK